MAMAQDLFPAAGVAFVLVRDAWQGDCILTGSCLKVWPERLRPLDKTGCGLPETSRKRAVAEDFSEFLRGATCVRKSRPNQSSMILAHADRSPWHRHEMATSTVRTVAGDY